MTKDMPPEEKLLRLIRQKAPGPATVTGAPAGMSPRPAGIAKTDHAAYHTKAGHKESVPFLHPRNILRIENLNMFLVVVLIGLVVYAAPILLKKQNGGIENLEGRLRAQVKDAAVKDQEAKKTPLDYFSGPVASKNIFAPVVSDDTRSPDQPPKEEGPKLEDIKGQLNLLGVMQGDNPQVIIEDKKANKTYFLNKGQTFGDVEVKDIMENKVILKYKEQQFELVL